MLNMQFGKRCHIQRQHFLDNYMHVILCACFFFLQAVTLHGDWRQYPTDRGLPQPVVHALYMLGMPGILLRTVVHSSLWCPGSELTLPAWQGVVARFVCMCVKGLWLDSLGWYMNICKVECLESRSKQKAGSEVESNKIQSLFNSLTAFFRRSDKSIHFVSALLFLYFLQFCQQSLVKNKVLRGAVRNVYSLRELNLQDNTPIWCRQLFSKWMKIVLVSYWSFFSFFQLAIVSHLTAHPSVCAYSLVWWLLKQQLQTQGCRNDARCFYMVLSWSFRL